MSPGYKKFKFNYKLTRRVVVDPVDLLKSHGLLTGFCEYTI